MAQTGGGSRRQAAGDHIAAPADTHPRRGFWLSFLRLPSVLLWLAVTAAGIVLALIPVNYAGQSLLSSAIAGAGIAGLMSEFRFCFDRREDDFDLQVQRQRYTTLEGQASQVDDLVKKTRIVVVNQMFLLGIDLYQTRFLPPDQAAQFADQAMDLASVLHLTPAVRAFLDNMYLRADGGLPPDGQDPFPPLKAAVRMRYASDAAQALNAGSIAGTVIHTAGGLVDEKYRALVVSGLRDAIELLYLLPPVYSNLKRAISELEESAYPFGYFGGYMALLSFYLSYRMTGESPEVAPLFEAPLSLTDPADVARVSQLLAKLSGQPVPAAPPAPAADAAAPAAAANRAPQAPWYRFINTGAAAFWLVVAIAGLVAAFVPWSFAAKDLLTSGVVGAGIAGVLSELTFCGDRRQAERNLAEQRRRYRDLRAQLDQVDELAKKNEIVAINQLFQLGMGLSWVRFGREEQAAGFAAEARQLAEILGMSAPVERFLTSPYLRPAEPLEPGQDPFPPLVQAAQLRYAHAGLEALRAGATLGLAINAGPLDPQMRQTTASVLKQAVPSLYLVPHAADNMLRAIADLEAGRCEQPLFLQYLILFARYLSYRMNGDPEDVVPLFESPVTLSQPGTAAQIRAILERMAAGPPPVSASAPSPPAPAASAPAEPAAAPPEPAASAG